MKWEPVIEVTQIKGDSETDPILSPTDEFADFEPFSHAIDTESLGTGAKAPIGPGDFARAALGRGLELEAKVGVNPYKFGMIGSTDSHTGMSSAEENNFHGKTAFDSTPANTFDTFIGVKGFGADMSASGMAGVWAPVNERTALFDAFRRKEVYATTGPRIRVRLFGGWGYASDDATKKELAQIGYANGVPMGGDLTEAPEGKAPRFLVYAIKGPQGANLDRVQMVKGWLNENGVAQEKVYNIAWSDDRELHDDGTLKPVALHRLGRPRLQPRGPRLLLPPSPPNPNTPPHPLQRHRPQHGPRQDRPSPHNPRARLLLAHLVHPLTRKRGQTPFPKG
jgi:hypothetical protein